MRTIKYIAILLICLQSGLLHAGGIMTILPDKLPPTMQNRYIVDSKSLKINMQVFDQTTQTTIEQVFVNKTGQRIEAWFLFPVPKGAIIRDFQMSINGKLTPAELLDAKEARTIYENIVRQMRDPALLEYADQNLFKIRIFPFMPNEEKTIKISYNAPLHYENNTTELFVPLATQKFNSKPLENVSLEIKIQSQRALKNIYSPTHEIETIMHNENSATIGFEADSIKPADNFKLYISNGNQEIDYSLLCFEDDENQGYFMLNLSPGFTSKSQKITQKDITFVFDVSGSMDGQKLEQAKSALKYCIENLPQDDKFQLVRFSTAAESLFDKRTPATKTNKDKAIAYIDKLRAVGGTNMEAALKLAFSEPDTKNRPHLLIFITDGKPTIGEIDQKSLLKKVTDYNAASTRIFTLGIGNELNTKLLDILTEQNRGYRTYVSENEDIESRIAGFFDKVNSPVLTDIKLQIADNTGATEIFPVTTSDLFKGENLSILGKYSKNGSSKISLSGNLQGQTRNFSYTPNFTPDDKYEFIPYLWATRHVGYLLDQLRQNGENKELIDEITKLAKKYGIITPYTSYLIMEDEQITTNTDIPIYRPHPRLYNQMHDDAETEYNNVKKSSGVGSIQSSQELQELRRAKNLDQSRQGSSRMAYKDDAGNTQNLTRQVINIRGRAVYQSGEQWLDAYALKNEENVKRIKFAGDEYFNLLNKTPEIGQFLQLGRNVRFAYNNQVYEIYEN